MWRCHDGVVFAGERAADRGFGGIERGASMGDADLADAQLAGCELSSIDDRQSFQG